MKILYLIHQFYPEWYTGTEKFVLNLASMMQKAGHEVKVITYSFYKNDFYDQSLGNIVFKEFIFKGVPVLSIKHKVIPAKLDYGLDDKDLSEVANEMISKEKPDVVHIGHSMRVSELVKVTLKLKIPFILTLTDFYLICPKFILFTSKNTLCGGPEEGKVCQNQCPELSVDFIKSRLEVAKDILFNADLVICPSRFLAGIFKKELPGLKIKIVNHGLNYSTIKRKEYRYTKNDKIVFCYAGSLNPHKGVHVLIEAVKQLNSNNVSLKIYGSGTDKPYVNHVLTMADKDPRIEFFDVYSEDYVGEVLSNVDVVITPSLWYENYPLVLHEAFACNIPVIASNIGGMAEKVVDGKNGFLFKVGDSQHLKEVLMKVIDNPEVLNDLKRNISKMMIPTVEQEAYTYERIYTQLEFKK